VVLCRLGDYEPALALYDDILAEYPGQAKVWMSYGHALKTAGRQEQAVAAYRRSIALEPGFGEAYWSLANLKTVRFDAADLAAMRAQLRAPTCGRGPLPLRVRARQGAGGRGDYARRSRTTRRGNAQRQGTIHYSADETTSRVDRTCRISPASSSPRAPAPVRRAGPDLHRRPAALRFDPARADPVQPLAGGGHDGAARAHLAHARPAQAHGRAGVDAYHDVLAALDHAELRALGERYLDHTRVAAPQPTRRSSSTRCRTTSRTSA
jgi:hypothetical protein